MRNAGSRPYTYSKVERALGTDNFDVLVTNDYSGSATWGAAYQATVVIANGSPYSSASSAMRSLQQLLLKGNRILMLGGAGSSSFGSYFSSYLISSTYVEY